MAQSWGVVLRFVSTENRQKYPGSRLMGHSLRERPDEERAVIWIRTEIHCYLDPRQKRSSNVNRVEDSVSCMKNGLCCSQAILCAYAESFGLDREMAVRLAAGFGGGMGRMAGTCGAVTGAYMVLGLKADAATAGDRQGRDQTYGLVRQFAERFTARNRSTTCKDLMGCDISKPEGLALAQEKGLFTMICPKMVQDAAEILEEMLDA